MKTEIIVIKAEKVSGGWILKASNGDLPDEGYIHKTRKHAYDDCDLMYHGDTWYGKKISSGYRIVIT